MKNRDRAAIMDPLEARVFLTAVLFTRTLLADNFPGTQVGGGRWYEPTWRGPADGTFLGRTQLRVTQSSPLPAVSNGAVHLTLDSYSPTGFSFWGSELISRQWFNVGDGLVITARAKLDTPVKGGVVAGLFAYAVKPGGVLHDEVDGPEIITNQAMAGANNVQTNVYANQPLGAGAPHLNALPSGKLTDWHTYEMRMYRDRVEWYIDGVIARIENKIVPKGPVQFYMNIWAPAKDWGNAYSASIQPTNNSKASVRVGSMSVDWVTVSQVVPPPKLTTASVAPYGQLGNVNGMVSGLDSGDFSKWKIDSSLFALLHAVWSR